MRIWKRLLGTALCLCAAVCVMSVSASAAEHSNHDNCGVVGCANTNHGHSAITAWNELKQANVDADGKLTLEDGKSYYLGEKINTTKAITITGTVNLCLNGNTLSSTYTVIEVKGGATLNICDCHGGGGITNTSKSNYGAINIIVKDGTALNLYGGKISSSAKHTVKLENKYSSNGVSAAFNMYGGEVYNDYSSRDTESCAIGIFGTSDSSSEINIFGGSVTSTNNNGIQTWSAENAQTHIAGGTVAGGNAALSVLGNLTLSGSPTICHAGERGVDIDITTSGATTPNDYITVTDNFTPAEGTKVSVDVPNNQLQTGRIIAKPAADASPLSGKAQYFVSAKEGYFVESNNDGDLQLTACAITEEPAVGNGYTVTANGSPTYQWYSATKGPVPVTDTTVTNEGSLNYAGERWSAYRIPPNGEVTGFTLTMKKGAVLTLDFSRSDVWVERVAFSDGQRTITGVEDKDHWQTYTLTAPADGDYTLTISASAEPMGGEPSLTKLSFTATMTADVPDTALTGQKTATLDTSQLETGSYICKVTWENKTTRNSQTVRYDAAPSHAHSWSSKWTSDDTHHWHECENGCTEKNGYAEHSGGAANCTEKAVCVTCGTAYGDLDPNGHDWGAWAVTTPATTSAAGVETRVCKRNASHTETRAIPKLTPAPSGGGSSSGSSSTPAITVPVSGSGDTVHVSASVSGSTAEVKEIKSAELDKIGTDSAVVIDLSGLNKGVTSVTLSTDTIDSICKTEADGVTVKLPNAELRVDRQTLAAVTEQAAGSKLRLVVEPDSTARNTMTAAQKSTLAGMKNAAALEAYFVSNDTRIHDFKGGSVELSIPYRAEGAIRAWFLKEDGTREPVSARYDKENAQLILHHFSHYVIEELDSSAAYTVCAKDDSCPLGAFGDLTATAWYHDGVHYCIEKGLMHGISVDKFLPDGSVTRAQLAAILWRLEGNPAPVSAAGFSDVADGAWYAGAVRWAADSGVVKGYADGRFRPNDAVTREQMAALLYRFAGYKGYDASIGEDTNILRFTDGAAVGGYAVPAMRWACGSGLMTGAQRDGGMALAPGDTTTRAQTATLLMRFQSTFAKEP